MTLNQTESAPSEQFKAPPSTSTRSSRQTGDLAKLWADIYSQYVGYDTQRGPETYSLKPDAQTDLTPRTSTRFINK